MDITLYLLSYFQLLNLHWKVKPWSHQTKASVRLIDRMRPSAVNRSHASSQRSFILVTSELAVRPVVRNFTITEMFKGSSI